MIMSFPGLDARFIRKFMIAAYLHVIGALDASNACPGHLRVRTLWIIRVINRRPNQTSFCPPATA